MAVSIALYGLMAGIRGCFLDHFDVPRALDAIELNKVTSVVGVPAMFARLLNSDPDPARLFVPEFQSGPRCRSLFRRMIP